MKVTETTKTFARKALRYIEDHPEQHDQSTWIRGENPGHCGTTMCVAGTVSWLKHGLGVKGVHSFERDASETLGLSRGEAQVLFYEMSEDRAKAKLAKIAKGEPFDKEDYEKAADRDEDPFFDEFAWDERDSY